MYVKICYFISQEKSCKFTVILFAHVVVFCIAITLKKQDYFAVGAPMNGQTRPQNGYATPPLPMAKFAPIHKYK